jgi:fibronectin-binding autotransporter adhesin
MASKYLSGTYNAGYMLNVAYTAVTIGATASIAGSGFVGNANPDTVVNLGSITATSASSAGVSLTAGGTLTNGGVGDTTALIVGAVGGEFGRYSGGAGVDISGGGTLVNWGTIFGGDGAPAEATIYQGSGGTGIVLSGGGSIGNSGTVAGGGAPGIFDPRFVQLRHR